MCGIAGILHLDGRPADPRRVTAMGAALAHRGPDDEGVWCDGPIGLANRRLSIIGLGPQGRQPMCDSSGHVWITYNGEIYNYQQLATDLINTGARLRTGTDTEVIVEAYVRWGLERTLQRLNGMFAFAIWNARERVLVLARDRLGIKPLYVDRDDGRVAFASELNALAPSRERPPAMDLLALDAYFAVGYVPQPRTIWNSASAVPPGSALMWRGSAESLTRYWRLGPGRRLVPRSFAEATAVVEEAVRLAVRRQLVSDVPVGIFLSSGLDSSIVASAAARERPGIDAVSIGYSESGFDESADAARTAATLGLQHSIDRLDPDLWSLLPGLASAYGQPFADASALAVSALSRSARARMKVALSGDGGDELFGGYPTYLASDLAGPYRRLPDIARAAARASARALPISHAKVGTAERLRRFLAAAEEPQPMAHLRWREHVAAPVRQRLLGSRPVAIATHFSGPVGESAEFPGGDRYLALDALTYLPSDILYKVDVASMTHGLEVRVPLLDHELVELAFSLPHDWKRNAFVGKRILRAAFRDHLPSTVLRYPKRGFNVPIASWLAGPLQRQAREVFASAAHARGVLDTRVAVELLEEHVAGRADRSYEVWTALIFCLWYEGLDPMGVAA